MAWVVNVTLGTEIRPPSTLAMPEAANVYVVEGCRVESGKTASLVLLCEKTKRIATGVLIPCPVCVKVTLEAVAVSVLKASGAVTSISDVSRTPTEPLAGVTVADSTWPMTLMLAAVVCPAVTCAAAHPESAVFCTEALKLTRPASAGIT